MIRNNIMSVLAEVQKFFNKFGSFQALCAIKNNSAFTLAEVLVTLGIIGVVAAMTFPMLARNYEFYIRQQQFKKVYAELSAAVQKTQFDMGENVKCYYTLKDDGVTWKTQTVEGCLVFYDALMSNLNVLQTCNGNAKKEHCIASNLRGGEVVIKELQPSELPKFKRGCNGITANYIQTKATVHVSNTGFSFMPYTYASVAYPLMIVDLNGVKNPNKWGHDVFLFNFIRLDDRSTILSLLPSQGCHPLERGGVYSIKFAEYLYGRNTNY